VFAVLEFNRWRTNPIAQLQTLGHHIFSAVAYYGALHFHRFWFTAVMAGLSEMSTIFLNNVLLCKMSYWREWVDQNASIFLVGNGVSLWLCFIIFRLCLFPLTIGIFIYDVYLSGHDSVKGTTRFEAIFYPLVLLGLFLLSAVWFQKINKGFQKAVFGQGLPEGGSQGKGLVKGGATEGEKKKQ